MMWDRGGDETEKEADACTWGAGGGGTGQIKGAGKVDPKATSGLRKQH